MAFIWNIRSDLTRKTPELEKKQSKTLKTSSQIFKKILEKAGQFFTFKNHKKY